MTRTIYEKETSRSDIYEQLWNIIGSNKENDYAPLYVDGPLFYNTIRPYLTTLSLPHTYGEYMAELPYIRSLYRYVLQIQKGLSKRRRSIPIQDDAFLYFVKIKITPEKKHRGENKETYFFRRSSRSSGSFVVIKSAASSIKYCKSSALFTVQTLTVKPKS